MMSCYVKNGRKCGRKLEFLCLKFKHRSAVLEVYRESLTIQPFLGTPGPSALSRVLTEYKALRHVSEHPLMQRVMFSALSSAEKAL